MGFSHSGMAVGRVICGNQKDQLDLIPVNVAL